MFDWWWNENCTLTCVVKDLLHVFCCLFLSKIIFFLDSISFRPPPVSVSLCLLHNTKTEISGFEAAHAIFIDIIAERWRHALTKVTPQVLKSSTSVFFFFLLFFSFLLSYHLHSWSAFIFLACSSAPFRSSSPAFFICCQMISETGLIPRPTPSSFPRVDVSVSICFWLAAIFFTVSHSYAHLAVFSHSVFFFCYYSSVTYMSFLLFFI